MSATIPGPPLLAELLRNEGRTQRWLSRSAKIPYTTLGRIVRGDRLPDVLEAQAIAHALGREIGELWDLSARAA